MSNECNKCDSILKENTLDPYSTGLGSSFRKWSLKNHPDKGGNKELFQDVNNCVQIFSEGGVCKNTPPLSDKKSEVSLYRGTTSPVVRGGDISLYKGKSKEQKAPLISEDSLTLFTEPNKPLISEDSLRLFTEPSKPLLLEDSLTLFTEPSKPLLYGLKSKKLCPPNKVYRSGYVRNGVQIGEVCAKKRKSKSKKRKRKSRSKKRKSRSKKRKSKSRRKSRRS